MFFNLSNPYINSMGSLNRPKQQDVRTRQKRKQMTPKEKAKELVDSFYRIIPLDKMTIDYNLAKQCALIAVDFMIKISKQKDDINRCYYFDLQEFDIEYLNKIKQEIEKL